MFGAMFAAARAVVPTTLLLLGLLVPAEAFAQPDYPSMLQNNFMLEDCTPSCGLCHLDPQGSGDRNAWGSSYGTAAALAPAAIPATQDSDGDGAHDVAELRATSDPGNAASTPQTAVALNFCLPAVPQFGCGARVARGTEDDGSAIAWLVIGAGLALKVTRKRRRR